MKVTADFGEGVEVLGSQLYRVGMGWLRFVGSLKLQVSLENIGLFCRALLQKRPIILRSLLIIATP